MKRSHEPLTIAQLKRIVANYGFGKSSTIVVPGRLFLADSYRQIPGGNM